ncbi:hypothetical protein V6Z12_A12G068700 [Gossypium hirsutum]
MMESSVPPGFRFHPTDDELVGYYLRKKVASQKIDLDVITDIDLYRIEPWDLQGSFPFFFFSFNQFPLSVKMDPPERCRIGYEEQKEWYFFSHKDKKYPTGTRTNRATMAGFWKATGRDKAVYDNKSKLIGMRKTLVFYEGRAPNGHKTDWIMHEYRLESDDNRPPQEEGWVICRAFKKKKSGQAKSIEGWESRCFYDEPSGLSSVIDPMEYLSKQPQKSLPYCKEETESDNLDFVYCDQFVELPQLEKNIVNYGEEEEEEADKKRMCNGNTKKVTDWRALDKFVASQLSHEDRYNNGDQEGASISSFDANNSSNSDMEALLLLQSSRERDKLKELLNSSTSHCEVGINIFDQ